MRATRDIDAEASSSYLVTWFRAFYNEVAALKASIRDGTLVVTRHSLEVGVPVLAGQAAEDQDDEAGQDETLDAVLTVRQKLVKVLERQENTAEQIGGEHSFHLYKLAQYVMAALADEVFLNLENWKGRDLWQNYLLEAKLFQSAAAGDRVFALIDKILHEAEPETVDLAKVCMMALSLDFQGRYRHRTDRAALARRRNDLYDFIAKHDKRLERERPVLVPEAYTATLSGGEAELLPNPRLWAWVLVFVFVTLFMVSWGVWQYTTGALRTHLDDIEHAADIADRRLVFDEDLPGSFSIQFEERWFGRRLVLGVKARSGMDEAGAATWLMQSRIATTSRIANTSRVATGVGRQRLFEAVMGLELEDGVVLFELQHNLDSSGPFIVSGERLIVRHPEGALGQDPPDLLFLYVEG